MDAQRKNLLLEQLQQIETELQSINFWSPEPSPVDPKECTEAFCADKMRFHQWLQYIFLPSARNSVETDTLPSSSMVGVKAMREYDYMSVVEKALPLVSLLSQFDALVSSQPESQGTDYSLSFTEFQNALKNTSPDASIPMLLKEWFHITIERTAEGVTKGFAEDHTEVDLHDIHSQIQANPEMQSILYQRAMNILR